ncbi:hypothetical protein OAK47_00385 [Planctomycetaceae bacterium]|jgi:hypothetical protein|nr:hypothetical protein [bacterium]MDB4786889.1 hypothetical protein [Planctomycetaceae bacterium]MDC0261654.1 hypothetical protein [Planctomycetaceae bacterium]MDC0273964.1 hypothetical protein [Planctomycetaceae bacterium]MDC0308442.1 hypothetical protein [Planctomycetaceae bacterium]
MTQQTTSIQTIQIIAAALMMGVVTFGGVAVVLQSKNDQVPDNNELPILLIVACVFTVIELGARQVVLMVFNQKLKTEIQDYKEGESSAEEFLGLYQTRLIISMALCEGAAFFSLIAVIVEGHWGGFAIAAFLLIIMGISFPTENKFREWVRTGSGQSAYAGDE